MENIEKVITGFLNMLEKGLTEGSGINILNPENQLANIKLANDIRALSKGFRTDWNALDIDKKLMIIGDFGKDLEILFNKNSGD